MPAIAPRAVVTGTYWWNRPTINALFQSPAGPPVFIWQFEAALARAKADNGCLVAWSSRFGLHHERACIDAKVPFVRIEDGFLRSIGLGAGFVTAASLAIDRRGIYYDATRPSDLEHLLETVELTDPEIREGARIRESILKARLTKYNLREATVTQSLPENRDCVLVPGQVSDDASILNTISSTIDPAAPDNVNIQLLTRARARNPDAYIIYKPHPDVVSGLRNGAVPASISNRLVDLVTTDASIIELIERVDRVETISSLAGFEALLRGKPVTTHGMPFYSGWGLTEDFAINPRRTRRRTIDELTAIAFTRYTRHMNPYTRHECNVHELINALIRQRTDQNHRLRSALLKKAAWLCEKLQI
jgi:capsular polysaccharide export protein